MAHRIRYDVLPNAGGWKIERDGVGVGQHSIKEDAVREATRKARDEHAAGALTQVLIRRHDGNFQDERTYGEDPFPPKG